MIEKKLSSYQRLYGVKGEISVGNKRTRTSDRFNLLKKRNFVGKNVVDIGCNNGEFCFFAKENGAKRVIGFDTSDCIDGAREVAKQKGLDIEFWQINADSEEFYQYMPTTDITILCSMLSWVKHPERLLKLVDQKTECVLYFETNASKKDQKQIDMVMEHTTFNEFKYLGTTDGYHDLYSCFRGKGDSGSRFLYEPITFVKLDDIEHSVIQNYTLESDRFAELKEKIKKFGLRQPLVLRRKGDKYFINQGTHRFNALKQLGYKYTPAKILKKVL